MSHFCRSVQDTKLLTDAGRQVVPFYVVECLLCFFLLYIIYIMLTKQYADTIYKATRYRDPSGREILEKLE